MAYGNNGGGFSGGGNNNRGGQVSFAKGSASINQNPKNENSRHFGGTLKFSGDGSARWLNVWIAHDRNDPQGTAKVRYIVEEMKKLGLYISATVGDIAPPQGQGQSNFGNNQGQQQSFGGNGFGGGQQGFQGGQQGAQPGFGNQGGAPQGSPQQGFQGGQGSNGGSGFGQGGFR